MELTAKDFVPIPIHEFVNGVTIPVDLYIRIGEEKFILVGKALTQSNVDQFKNYQNREVSYLWVRKKEYYKLAHQSISLAGIALSKKELDDTQKTTVVSAAARTMFRHVEHLGIDLETYNNSKQITEAVVGLVENHKTLSGLFKSLAKFSDQLVGHSVAVSSLSVLIAQNMGFQKKATLEKVAMGGLLHDIGLKALPHDLINKPIAEMTADEHQLYETHSFKGMQMLQSLGIVPDDIVSIVYEHHENSIGQGYPQRLRDVKMHPLAKVVSLANGYADLILPNVNCPVPKNPREALMYIEHTLGIPYNREAFRALKKVIDSEKKAA
ncbi:MAG: HD domain-containing protein [Bdellovibrionales bacterium]|nr:HD domain-containing protein [Bdellovibrionales bacterium]